MRLLLILFLIHGLGHCTALANFGNFHAIGVDDSATYRNHALCEKAESEKPGFQGCFSISQCPTDECSLKDVQVPDREQDPTLIVTDEQACADEAECTSLIAQDGFCTDESYASHWGDRDEDGSLEAWCTHPEWPTKTVTRLEPDQDKIAAKEAAEQAERQERQAKEQALETIKTELKDCAGVLEGDVQPPKLQACLEALAKWSMRKELQSGELDLSK